MNECGRGARPSNICFFYILDRAQRRVLIFKRYKPHHNIHYDRTREINERKIVNVPRKRIKIPTVLLILQFKYIVTKQRLIKYVVPEPQTSNSVSASVIVQ